MKTNKLIKLHLPSIRGNFYTRGELVNILKNKNIGEPIILYSEFATIGSKKIPIESKLMNGRPMYRIKENNLIY